MGIDVRSHDIDETKPCETEVELGNAPPGAQRQHDSRPPSVPAELRRGSTLAHGNFLPVSVFNERGDGVQVVGGERPLAPALAVLLLLLLLLLSRYRS